MPSTKRGLSAGKCYPAVRGGLGDSLAGLTPSQFAAACRSLHTRTSIRAEFNSCSYIRAIPNASRTAGSVRAQYYVRPGSAYIALGPRADAMPYIDHIAVAVVDFVEADFGNAETKAQISSDAERSGSGSTTSPAIASHSVSDTTAQTVRVAVADLWHTASTALNPAKRLPVFSMYRLSIVRSSQNKFCNLSSSASTSAFIAGLGDVSR
jgi:hypothetical protein